MTDRAGTPALDSDLIDTGELVDAYYSLVPDVSVPEQKVVFGTSGHRGSSLDTAFNETHIAAITQAMRDASAVLGNTPAIARASYVDPRLLDHYRAGDLIDPARPETTLRALLFE